MGPTHRRLSPGAAAGHDLHPLHYHDIDTHRAAETQRLLEACGISSRHLEQAMTAFAEDSHKGSVGANTTPARALNAKEAARAVRLFALMGRRAYVGERLPDSWGLTVGTEVLSNSPSRIGGRGFA